MYFIGVTTGESLIMRAFPLWTSVLELGDADLIGIDLPPGSPPPEYRRVVDFIADDPLSLGALVTTHKLDLFEACRDRFAEVDEFAALMREASSISKRDGGLACHAKDPISGALALESIVPSGHWGKTDAEAFVIGAGGAATAITWHLRSGLTPGEGPSRILASDIDEGRLLGLRSMHDGTEGGPPIETVLARSPADNDDLVSRLPAGSLIVNATGLGKDAPGSPLTDAAVFPDGALAWELNYRGDLLFIDQARRGGASVSDGWVYFLHGWTQVIAEVFDRPIPSSGPVFAALAEAAESVR